MAASCKQGNGENMKPVDGKNPPTDQDEYRTERAGIMAISGNPEEFEAETRAVLSFPCSCGGNRFWVSVHGPIICGACHPPQEKAVKRWVEIPGAIAKV